MGRKHIPQRTCVGCRQVRSKREMVRVVRTPEGEIVVDETGKRNGRGAYLCRRASCWHEALSRGRLAHALRTQISPETLNTLRQYADTLPTEDLSEGS